MTDRLALLPLTGAGERECKQCRHLDAHEAPFAPSCQLTGYGLCSVEGRAQRDSECLSAERDAARLRAVEVASVRAVELLQETRFMAIGSGPIAEWAKTPEGKNHALVWEALQALRAALKE